MNKKSKIVRLPESFIFVLDSFYSHKSELFVGWYVGASGFGRPDPGRSATIFDITIIDKFSTRYFLQKNSYFGFISVNITLVLEVLKRTYNFRLELLQNPSKISLFWQNELMTAAVMCLLTCKMFIESILNDFQEMNAVKLQPQLIWCRAREFLCFER